MRRSRKLAPFVIGLISLLGLFLPTLGVSLVLVLVTELCIRRFNPRMSRWLGLRSALTFDQRAVSRSDGWQR